MTSLSQADFDTQTQARRAFVVAGMHRSGTSAMTRTLSLLGAALPAGLMRPVENNNETGFWESQSVAELNDEILQTRDSDWDELFAFHPREHLSNFDRLYIARAVELLNLEFNGSDLIVLKDPRISVLSAFWENALREAGYATNYVLMVRNPLEVAESLKSRDGFAPEKGLLLWSSYMLAVERDTRGLPRTFVAFDDLMRDWRQVRRRVEEGAGVPFPRGAAAATKDIDKFLEVRLRHHERSAEDLFSRSGVLDEVKTLYRIFSAACAGADVDCTALDEIQLRLEKMGLLVTPLIADLRESARRLSADTKSLARQLVAEREARKAEAESAASAATEHQRLVSEFTSRISALEADRHHLVAELKAERHGLTAQLSEKARQIDELSAQFASAEADRVRSAAIAKAELEKEREAHLLEQMRSSDVSQQLQEREKELAAKNVDLESTTVRLVRANSELKRAEGEVSSLNQRLREARLLSDRYESQVRWLTMVEDALATNTRGWRGLMPLAWRRRRQLRVLRDRGLFDSEAYLERYPDIASAGVDPLRHYIQYGMGEGREAVRNMG